MAVKIMRASSKTSSSLRRGKEYDGSLKEDLSRTSVKGISESRG